MQAGNPGRLLRRVVDVRDDEVGSFFAAFGYFFLLLASYYVLRPLRDEMGIAGDVKNLSWMFTGTFVVMLLASPAFAAIVARFPRRRIVPVTYHVFAASLLLFWLLLQRGAPARPVAWAVFIWVSVYNLFVVSIFWSLMADLFDSGQGRRLFGAIAAGGSAGALAGSALVALLVERLGTVSLFLVSAALLEASLLCVGALLRRASVRREAAAAPRIGGGWLAGLKHVVAVPYLRAIALQTICLTTTATVLYFEQERIVAESVPTSEARTALFATIDTWVNALGIALQLLVTGQVLTRLGLVLALGALPVLCAAGFVALALAPTLAVLVGFQVARRALHHGLERPAREVLFTVVPPEDKYKTKNAIDTVVYRGSDAVAGWALKGLQALGLAPAGIALAALPVAGIWLVLVRYLGGRQRALAADLPVPTPSFGAPP